MGEPDRTRPRQICSDVRGFQGQGFRAHIRHACRATRHTTTHDVCTPNRLGLSRRIEISTDSFAVGVLLWYGRRLKKKSHTGSQDHPQTLAHTNDLDLMHITVMLNPEEHHAHAMAPCQYTRLTVGGLFVGITLLCCFSDRHVHRD